jgi:hypothetical protein
MLLSTLSFRRSSRASVLPSMISCALSSTSTSAFSIAHASVVWVTWQVSLISCCRLIGGSAANNLAVSPSRRSMFIIHIFCPGPSRDIDQSVSLVDPCGHRKVLSQPQGCTGQSTFRQAYKKTVLLVFRRRRDVVEHRKK